ncbi:MAG: sarcosine oxidase subunit alpha family protein [Rhodobacteraceae bacterium]|nr:sarcosine oxidase subunit alpha family protein [Paracoccaceae bacterium]
MSFRLPDGGCLIDRSQPVAFTFNGKRVQGFRGDTLASALMAADRRMVGRSFKYHRPRGIMASGVEEPNALMNMGEGGRFEPNQRATTTELFDGLIARSQNHWPSLGFDIGALNNKLARFLPAGFYYKTFMRPQWAWKHVFEPIIRRSAGLGQVPTKPDTDRYEYFYAYTDILIAGGGVAGLEAALEAGRSGAKVLLLEQSPYFGGRFMVDDVEVDGRNGPAHITYLLDEIAKLPTVTLRSRTQGAGVFDHGYALGFERLNDHAPTASGPRHRLWRIRAKRIITATGALERTLNFAGNDKPGVMLAGAVRDYVRLYGVAPGARTVVVTNSDDAYRTALTLHAAGLEVPLIVDSRPQAGALADAARQAGIRIETGHAIARVNGYKHVTSVEICLQSGAGNAVETVACDCVAMSGGFSPVVHLWSHCGGKLLWDEANAMFSPDISRPPTNQHGEGFVLPAGAALGALETEACLASALAAGRQAVDEVGQSRAGDTAPRQVRAQPEAPMSPVWAMPANAPYRLRSKTWLDFQNDVKLTDIQLAAREGYESVEHAKRYTTIGMATDQGKLSNINGLAVLAAALDADIPAVGTTTFRPPYTPVSLGAIAGEAAGKLFKPTRKTAIDGWHESHGAIFEPVADWRRPYAYPAKGESVQAAITREIVATRSAVGLFDASTLGKIMVTGPDAARFLDLLYTNMMSTLKPGKCRYGLMCNENGFLMDDGVVARLSEDTFLCHTTTGGSDRIHAHMEEWLQTEWWDMQVFTANLTEQYAQIVVAGPRARKVLEALGGMDVSPGELPFMGFVEGKLGGIKARIFRISFSGELSFEVAVPASRGLLLWNLLLQAGASHGIRPYGTEALHVMRAEKGFVVVGDESDGTVTPHDLNMSWAVSKKKDDFIGKRGMQRSFLTGQNRKQLVGLRTLSDTEKLPESAHAVENGKAIGHVTSTYFSPTLGHPIAMALINGGQGRLGDVLDFSAGGAIRKARIVDPVFYDKEGARQDV